MRNQRQGRRVNGHGINVIEDVLLCADTGRIMVTTRAGPVYGTRQELKRTIKAIVRAIQLTDLPQGVRP